MRNLGTGALSLITLVFARIEFGMVIRISSLVIILVERMPTSMTSPRSPLSKTIKSPSLKILSIKMLTPPKKLARESLAAMATAIPAIPAEAKKGVRFTSHSPKSQITASPRINILSSFLMMLKAVAGILRRRKMKKDFVLGDFKIFERWLKKYVSNWASCDGLCTGPLGDLLVMYPELISKTTAWRRSSGRWVRRAAAVSLILPVKSKQSLKDVFLAADDMLMDQDDMVQKGYGWILKEASNVYSKEVFHFVMERKDRMPRTALRYAIEKMPEKWRKKAMQK